MHATHLPIDDQNASGHGSGFSLPDHSKLVQAIKSNHFFSPALPLGILRISGSDAALFLQGQLTNDIHKVNETSAQFSAHCDIKGRVLANCLIWQQDCDYFLALSHDLLATTEHNLKRYVLRDKVIMTDETNHYVCLGVSTLSFQETWGITLSNYQHYHTDAVNGWDAIALPNQTTLICTPRDSAPSLIECLSHKTIPIDSTMWQLTAIRTGIVWITQQTTATFIPQMIGMDKLDAISFNKGCYTGQEVIARTRYLGQIKRHLYHVQSNKRLTPNETWLNDKGESVGQVVAVCPGDNQQDEALAVMKDAAWQDQNTLQLANGIILKKQAVFRSDD